MAFFFLSILILTESKIPIQHKELADQALRNANRKIPKELREETKYPGEYYGDTYHYTIRKICTNAFTNDIKGFAVQDSNVAIVTRKHFNLTNDYVFIDSETQTIYLMKRKVATYGNILIYEASETDIFSFLTSFDSSTSTDGTVPLNKSIYEAKLPRTTITVPLNWDSNRSLPVKRSVDETPITYGFGASAEVGITTKLHIGLRDSNIGISISLLATLGAELAVPDNCVLTIPDQKLFESIFSIPRIGYSTSILGYKIAMGVNFHFLLNLTDTTVNIPVGFDYYKGYQLQGSKYYSITTNGVTESSWNLQWVDLPEISSVDSYQNSLLSSSLTASFNVVPYFSLDLTFGQNQHVIELGLLLPFQYRISFNSQKCLFPYLSTSIQIPCAMFCLIPEVVIPAVLPRKLFPSYFQTLPINELSYGPFCINKPGLYIEGNNKSIQEASEESKVLYITYEGLSDTGEEGSKRILLVIEDEKSKVVGQHPLLDTTTSSDILPFVVLEVPSSATLNYYLYCDGIEHFKTSFSISSLSQNKQIVLDTISFQYNFEECQFIESGQLFSNPGNYVAFKIPPSFTGYYSGIFYDYFGGTNQILCDYTSSSWMSTDYRIDQYYYQTNENIKVQLSRIQSTKDDFSAEINLYLNYQNKTSHNVKVLIGVYTISDLTKDTEYSSAQIGLADLSFTCYAPKSSQSSISIEGKIHYKSMETSVISETILYDNQLTDEREISLDDGTTAIFSITLDSPIVLADLTDLQYEFPPPVEEFFAPADKLLPAESNTIAFHFLENEKCHIIEINLSDFQDTENMHMLIYADVGSLTFLYDNDRKTLSENCFYCYVSPFVYLYMPFRRDQIEEATYNIQIEFFRCDNSNRIIKVLNRESKTTIQFDKTLPYAFIVPCVNGRHWYFSNATDQDYTEKVFVVNETAAIVLRKYTQIPSKPSVDFYLAYSQLPENVPIYTINLDYISPYLSDTINSYQYYIYFPGGYKIQAQSDNEILQTVDVNEEGVAEFTLTRVGDISFSPLCRDNKGKMCLITYEAPTSTGFHLIRYPNTDGISITGSGFPVELIPVVEGQSFTYYKTYEEPIELIREYSNEEVSIEMKITNIPNTEQQKVCLYIENKPNEIIPFSRKYYKNHFNDLLASFNVNKDQITSDNLIVDPNGCLVFHGLKISKEDIQSISNEACDLPTKSITISDDQPDAPPSDESTITDDPTEPESDPTEESSISEISDDPTEPESDPTEPESDPTEPESDPTEESSTSVIGDDPTEPELDPPEEPTNPDSSLSKKTRAVIISVSVIFGVIVIALAIVLSMFFFRRHKHDANLDDELSPSGLDANL